MNIKTIKLDINKKLYEIINAKQGDTESRFLFFNLFDGSTQFDLTNKSVRAYAKKPDKTEIYNDLVINDAIKGYCTLELTNQMLAVSGTVEMELVIIEGTKKLSSIPFILNVISSVNSENAIISTNEFTSLLNALASLNEYDNYKNEIATARGGEANLDARFNGVDASLADIETQKADKVELENVQTQVNNLVLGAVGDGNDAEIIQARGDFYGVNHATLKSHLDSIEKDIITGYQITTNNRVDTTNSCGQTIESFTGGIAGNKTFNILAGAFENNFYYYVKFYNIDSAEIGSGNFNAKYYDVNGIELTNGGANIGDARIMSITWNSTFANLNETIGGILVHKYVSGGTPPYDGFNISYLTNFAKDADVSSLGDRMETLEYIVTNKLIEINDWQYGQYDANGVANGASAMTGIRTIGFHSVEVGKNVRVNLDIGYTTRINFYDDQTVVRLSLLISSSQNILIKYPFFKQVIIKDTPASLEYASHALLYTSGMQTDIDTILNGELENCYVDEIERVKETLFQKPHGLTFTLANDIHIDTEYDLYKMNIISKCGEFSDFICLNGDIINGSKTETKEKEIDLLYKTINETKNNTCAVLPSVGNHDVNFYWYSQNANYTNIINNHEFDNATMKGIKIIRDANHPEQLYYYVDFESYKIRAIFLNFCQAFNDDGSVFLQNMASPFQINNEQVLWLRDIALRFDGKEDWGVLVFSHCNVIADSVVGYIGLYNVEEITSILNAFKNGSTYTCIDSVNRGYVDSPTVDYSEQGPMELIGVFSGHSHYDCANVDNSWSIANIVTANDLNSRKVDIEVQSENTPITTKSAPIRTAGTATTELFDIVKIDRKNKVIDMTRYGAGNSRLINY